MAAYLVVNFNRYDTERSTHTRVPEAMSPVDAICQAGEFDGDPDAAKWVTSEIVLVDEIFSCISGEESDTLVYKI